TAPLIASVNAPGLVTPLAVGTTTIRASLDGQLATAVVTVRATPNANAPTVTAIAPASLLRPGASYVLTGNNFAPTTSGNAVVVDGVAATVTAASMTSLSVTLPTSGFPCEPTHGVYLQVTANGLVGATATTLQAANQRTLLPGQSVIVTNAAEVRCNETVAPAGRYVVSVYNAGRQSVTPSTSAPVQFQVRGAVPATAASASVVAEAPPRARWNVAVPRIGGGAFDDAELLRRLRLHDMAHAEIQRRNLENLRANAAAIRAAAAARPRLALARTASAMGTLGAITQLKVPNLDAGNFCQSSVPVGARTAYVGQHALILEDTASTYNGAPTLAGQMDSTYASIGQEFDTVMWPILTGDFGNPLAMDAQLSGTGKVVMLFSPKVNAMQSGTVLGFVVSCDFSPVSQQPSSNVGEYFYAVVPTSAAPGYTSANGRA
ncbi:MAG: IPT/TIG domain-containing protein, partial [Gemmatimonadetes bacterium]|nr:IPT/TIG domain-containing protein [Gemmatimonadota bacterium]